MSSTVIFAVVVALSVAAAPLLEMEKLSTTNGKLMGMTTYVISTASLGLVFGAAISTVAIQLVHLLR